VSKDWVIVWPRTYVRGYEYSGIPGFRVSKSRSSRCRAEGAFPVPSCQLVRCSRPPMEGTFEPLFATRRNREGTQK
jgi:hypothetical protein